MLLNKKTSILYFIKEIKYEILFITLFAVTVGILDEHPIFQNISFPLAVPVLIGTALSVLLAFRISQSYERWWEARTIWGAIVNDSRTLLRQVIQFTGDPQHAIAKDFAERQIIWTYALGESLRKLKFSERVDNYLHLHRITELNTPNGILDRHSIQVGEMAQLGLISDYKLVQLNETIGRLCDSMGKCERIKNTVFPRSYSLLIHSLIYVFILLFPLGLAATNLGVEITLTILLPLIFISIEKTAVMMQDPFENTPIDTPMTTLAQSIEINLLQMIRSEELPKRNTPNSYYIL